MSKLSLALLLAIAVGCLGCGRDDHPRQPDVVVIVIDTWRFDALGLNGSPRRGITPELDALASSGVRFERAIGSSPWTLPSMASLFTGHYPTMHGAHGHLRDVASIRASLPTLAELLAVAGYRNHAIVNAPFLDPGFGFERGFQTYDYYPSSNVESRRAAASVDAALALLREDSAGRPSFLFLHLFDPHLAYDPPAPWDARWTTGYEGPLRPPFTALKEIREGTLDPTPEDAAFMRALYDGEVSYTDQELGRFFRALEQLQSERDRWIIVTADHGEEFRDHGGWEHGHTMYAEQLRVPLLIIPPAGFKAKISTVSTQVRVLDLFPTILESAGLTVPAGVAGQSLLPILEGLEDQDRVAFSEREHLGTPAMSLRDGDYTLIYHPNGEASELFEFDSDPLEMRDLAAEQPQRVREMEAALKSLADSLERQSAAAGSEAKAMDLDPQLLQRLRSLGYAGG